jgi:hypothetical protein
MSLGELKDAKKEGYCDECNETTTPLVPADRPDKGEFYCQTCKKSYRMTIEMARQFLLLAEQRAAR